jgi:hypothetical protein
MQSIFRLVDSDNKVTSRILKKHDDELSRALRSAVPGLVNLSTTANSNPTADHLISTSSSHTLEDRSSSGSAAAGGASSAHRVLVKPDAFNVSVLFQPTLAFLERAGSVMPVGIEDESSGLDEFVVKVYLPQLEEKVSDLFQLAVTCTYPFYFLGVIKNTFRLVAETLTRTASEAFEEDSGWRLVSNKPVTKVRLSLHFPLVHPLNLSPDSLCSFFSARLKSSLSSTTFARCFARRPSTERTTAASSSASSSSSISAVVVSFEVRLFLPSSS